MSKPVFGMLLGGFLGIFDGLTALISAPETRPEIVGIVIGSTFKGILTGLLIGLFTRKVRSLPLGIAFGIAMGLLFAYFVAAMQGKYYFEIMLPGAILGLIVGYATYVYGGAGAARPPVVAGLVVTALLAGASPAPSADAAKPARADGKAALERLKSLAGTWRGHVVTPDGPEASVVYSVTAGGSTVQEKLFPGTDHEMVTMYHLDGNDLVLTHYCAMGNQPRMRLVTATGADPLELRFDFAGGANVDPAKDAHMHAGTIKLQGRDRLEAVWAVYDKGKQAGANNFYLDRVKTPAARP